MTHQSLKKLFVLLKMDHVNVKSETILSLVSKLMKAKWITCSVSHKILLSQVLQIAVIVYSVTQRLGLENHAGAKDGSQTVQSVPQVQLKHSHPMI
jgi:hypothetical protein